MRKTTTVRLPAELYEAVKATADRQKRTFTEQLEFIVQKWFDSKKPRAKKEKV